MIKKIVGRFPVQSLIRVACYLAIVALGLMVWSVVMPTALPVVIGMSVGQGVGILGFLCFLLAVLGDTQRSGAVPSVRPAPAPEHASEDDPPSVENESGDRPRRRSSG